MLKLFNETYNKVRELYLQGNSAQEIKDQLSLSISVRQIQRRLAQEGLTRSVRQAFHLAIIKNRMVWKDKTHEFYSQKELKHKQELEKARKIIG